MTATLAPPTTGLAFTTDAKPLAAATAWAARRVPQRPTVPILGGILLDVTDGQLTLSGFDYDVAAMSRIPVNDATDGRALVSGRLLAELVKTFPNRPVQVAVAGEQLNVVCGALKLSLPMMTIDDYPTLPTIPAPIGTIDAATFAAVVERVAVAAGGPGNPLVVLTGVHLTFHADRIQLIGTDRYRGAVAETPWQATTHDAPAALVPVDVLTEAARAIDGAEAITIAATDGLISFATASRTIVARLLDSKDFPVRFPGLVPPRADTPIVVPVADLTAAVKRAALVLEPKMPVRLHFSAGEVTVSASRERDLLAEVIDCQYEGDDLSIAANPGYLVDALAALHSDIAEVSLSGGSPKKPVLLTAPGDTSYRHVIMPIRSN